MPPVQLVFGGFDKNSKPQSSSSLTERGHYPERAHAIDVRKLQIRIARSSQILAASMNMALSRHQMS